MQAGAKWNTLGYEWDHGINRPTNKKKAFRCFFYGAQLNCLQACANLASFYRYGIGCQINLEKSLVYELKAAKGGFPESMYEVARAYKYGYGTNIDPVACFFWSQETANHKLPSGYRYLALCFRRGIGCKKDYKSARKWFKLASKEGDVTATSWLADMTQDGLGGERDLKEAFRLYSIAAEKGHADSMMRLAFCYDLGKGVKKDDALAFTWYKKAAESGEGEHLYWLGKCYEKGQGCIQDVNAALGFYHHAMEKNYHDGLFSAGLLHKEKGEYDLALCCFEKSRLLGTTLTCASCSSYQIASMYEWGEGCAKDTEKAMEFYKEAAEGGCACAMRALGVSYEYGGDMVQRDQKQAFQWYLKTLDFPQNTAQCLKEIAKCFAEGIGCEKNLEMSANLLKIDELPKTLYFKKCCICLEKQRLTILPCMHQFHSVCLAKSLLKEKVIRCSLCRSIY